MIINGIEFYFNSQRQFLLSIIRYIDKPLNAAFKSVLTRLENLGSENISSDLRETIHHYHNIFQQDQRTEKKFDPRGIYAYRAIQLFMDYHYEEQRERERDILYQVKYYLKATQTYFTIAERNFEDYLIIQKMNIFGSDGVFRLDWVNKDVWNAACDIWMKKHWEELPMLADMCEMSGCTDNTILSYLRNSELHKGLRIHCWALELILKQDPKESEVNEWTNNFYVGR